MRLNRRLDALARQLPTPRATHDASAGVRRLCELLEKHAPIPAGETYADMEARIDAVLDRLHDAGVGIPAGPHTSRMMRVAAAYGMTTAELHATLHERARGDA
ncbi:MAG: hypothetical protein ACR2M3_08775 [Thermomicrobiales bacterium]